VGPGTVAPVSENVRNYLRALFGFEHAVRSVADDTWERASPCELWSVRDVVGHGAIVVSNVAARAGNGPVVDPFAPEPRTFLGADPVDVWRCVRDRVVDVLDDPRVLDTRVESRLGEMSFDDYVGLMVGDALIHTWDIARGSGGDERLDPYLVPVVLATYERQDEAVLRGGGRYGPVPHVGSAGAAASGADRDLQTRLLRFTGRTP
jgi:uncharacterized protein (TIGR03086 family)